MQFSERLKLLRSSNKISQADLAIVLNVSQRQISYYENNKDTPPLPSLILLADYFMVSLDYLVGRSDDPRHEEFIEKAEKDLLTEIVSDNFTIWLFYKLPDLYTNLELRRDTYSIERRLKIIFALRKLIEEQLEYKAEHQKALKSFEPTLANQVKKRISYSLNKTGLMKPPIYAAPSPDDREKNQQLHKEFHELIFGELQEEYVEETNSKPSLFKKKRYTKTTPINTGDSKDDIN